MSERLVDCGTRRKFKWNDINKRKSELTTPAKCLQCDPDQFDYCKQKSWVENGKDADLYDKVNVMVNQNPLADSKTEKAVAKAKQKLEQLSDDVEETKEAVAEEQEAVAEQTDEQVV
jgi:ElaB/YqjD/DUF883 family membrane-anchored ribosome-binding protein